MADAGDIDLVRRQTGQMENVLPYDDEYIDGLVDAYGVTGATITIWNELKAKYATLVDVTEAGASHKFSDLFEHATKQAAYYEGILLVEVGGERTRVKKVVRTS